MSDTTTPKPDDEKKPLEMLIGVMETFQEQ
jgi:hypothetical protein